MGQQFPASFQHGVGHRLAPVEGDGVGGATGLDAEFVEQVYEAPQADALAIFAPGVIGEVGRVARQDVRQDRRAAGIIGLVGVLGEIPGFQVEGQDEGDAGAIGPFERLALGQRDIIIVHVSDLSF